MRFPNLSPRAWKVILSMLAAGLVAAGVITVSPDNGHPPPVSPDSYGTGTGPPAAAGAATPYVVTVGEHNLNEPGDTAATLPRTAAPPASIAGCRVEFNHNNFSVRTVKVREIAEHYTVSPNVAGWADVEGNRVFLDKISTKASAHFIVDAEGNCAYTVPITLKAWTEVNGNGFSVGIENVGTGAEGKLSAAALKTNAEIIVAVAKTEGIPIQLGDVDGCSPNRPGIVDHAMYGACGGGHHDIRPYYGTNVVRQAAEDHKALDPIINAAKKLLSPLAVLTPAERSNYDTLVLERAVAKRHGGWHVDGISPAHLQRANAAKAKLQQLDAAILDAVRKTGWAPNHRAERHHLISALI